MRVAERKELAGLATVSSRKSGLEEYSLYQGLSLGLLAVLMVVIGFDLFAGQLYTPVPYGPLRTPSALKDTRVNDRFSTPAWWAKALTLWRIGSAMSVVFSLALSRSALARYIRRNVLTIGLLIELGILAYMVAVEYVTCNQGTYPSSTCHDRRYWCGHHYKSWPSHCPNDSPVPGQPPVADLEPDPFWMWRLRCSIMSALLTLALLALSYAQRYNAPAPAGTRGLARDVGRAYTAYSYAALGVLTSAALLFLWGLGTYQWTQRWVGGGGLDPPRAPVWVDYASGPVYWLALAQLLHLPAVLIAFLPVLRRDKPGYARIQVGALMLSVVVAIGTFALCVVAFYSCQSVTLPWNPCNDRRICCVAGGSVTGDACVGIPPRCPDGPGGAMLGDLGQLEPYAPFLRIWVSLGWLIVWEVLSLIALIGVISMRDQVRQAGGLVEVDYILSPSPSAA